MPERQLWESCQRVCGTGSEENAPIVGHIFAVIAKLADELGFAGPGYRVVSNIGKAGQQSVPHLHFHVLAGRDMTWPPG